MSKFERAAIVADKLRKDLDISEHNSIDLEQLAIRLGIKIKRIDLGDGIEGVSKSNGNKHLVILKPFPYSPEKERFTLAHEIGHILIHHGSHYCKAEYFHAFRTQADIEREANEFAEELLMPKQPVYVLLKNTDLSWTLIRQISDKYIVSISAAAIRAVNLFDDDAIIIWHDGNTVKWHVRSDNCFWKLNKTGFADFSYTALASDGVNSFKMNIQPMRWIDCEIDDLQCEEETVFFNNLKQYLTILKFYRA
ncbi:MAG: ImmA/IrrE family metallo-endopeptidase [Christensenellaceae bacterium]